MTLRPQVIRADTIDLQDPIAPSAQDHSHQPTHPAPLGLGPAAPHQNAELKHLADERTEEEHHLSEIWNSGQLQNQSSPELFMDDSPRNNNRSHPHPRLDTSIGQNGLDDSDLVESISDERLETEAQIDDKMSSSPSIVDEDIDFEFVYALHNFVATVEGQANANKGDTMVLLDDSNSYWWLVRLMRDNSIGYLPAEHIETPTERLARLNKHRNIDLSASMLGDNAEKSKNPIKKAMRRRNAKLVTFTTPTYYEPLAEWSDNEPDDPDKIESEEAEYRRKGSQLDRAKASSNNMDGQNAQSVAQDDSRAVNGSTRQDIRFASDRESLENASLDGQDGSARSRNGSSRNTDSYLQEENGTRKITLTPDLLRDDSSRNSMRSPEPRGRGSSSPDTFDQLGRLSPTSEKAAEDKKKKEKKPNMLSGLFKRKDKKIKVDEAAGSIVARQDENGATVYSPTGTGRASPSSGSGRSSPSGSSTPVSLRTMRSNSGSKLGMVSQNGLMTPSDNGTKPEPESIQSLQGRSITPETRATAARTDTPVQAAESDMTRGTEPTESSEPSSSTALPPASETDDPVEPLEQPEPIEILPQLQESIRTDQRDETEVVTSLRAEDVDRPIETKTPELPENAVEIAHLQADTLGPSREPASEIFTDIPPLSQRTIHDTAPALFGPPVSSSVTPQVSMPPTSEAVSSPSNAHHHDGLAYSTKAAAMNAPAQSLVSASVPMAFPRLTPPPDARWDDAALHNYLERNGTSLVKDMLIVVHDNTGVKPLPMDHPTMLELGFHEKKKRLDELTKQLDNLVVDFVERKRIIPPSQSQLQAPR